MKIISFEEFLNLENSILIDVRTPKEFILENIPNSVNIPILLDEERVEVGTTYKHSSKEEAKLKGIEYISKRLPEIFIEIQKLSRKYKNLVFICARGGMRSGTIASLVESLGYKVAKIKDGYKGYRKYVSESIPLVNKKFNYIVIHGKTGVGKTKILKELSKLGYPVMDLENYASHKGSFFGGVGENIPQSQKRFDGYIFEFLKKNQEAYIIVESESKRIGNVYIPETVYESMIKGLHIYVDTNIDNRIKILIEDYAYVSIDELKEALKKVSNYISKDRYERYLLLLEQKEYEEFARVLIEEYYDPLYEISIKKHRFDYNYCYKTMDEIIKILCEYIDNLKKHE